MNTLQTSFLTCSRGEIATRILCSARELGIETHAIYVSGDASHAARADHVITLPSPSAFMDVDALIRLVKEHQIDAVHPGYGFLSESDVFAKRMWEEAGAVVVGPGWGVLASTGDKLKARALAAECKLLILRAFESTGMDMAMDLTPCFRQCPGVTSVAKSNEQRGGCVGFRIQNGLSHHGEGC